MKGGGERKSIEKANKKGERVMIEINKNICFSFPAN